MNTQYWINHYETNTRLNDAMTLPAGPSGLPEAVRKPVARSLAVFQLGESGGGTRLKRYARVIAPLAQFSGYQRAIDLFVAEEQSHAALLSRLIAYLNQPQLHKQWTNSIFRWARNLVNLEFNIQILLTAELVAEVYFGLLYLRCADPAVKKVSHKLLRDEMQHLEFQRQFLAERLQEFTPATRRLWCLQFRLIHRFVAAVVSWDHRDCLKAIEVSPAAFRSRCTQSLERFMDRLDTKITKTVAENLFPESLKAL
ncbi:MAG: long-chain fatty aldehyde decarbonylase [Verrucomicrobiaceae bacterium]|nr:long-chain fatty aldehyde decarbonylase [Verrucomicrobiaceae bacterium]